MNTRRYLLGVKCITIAVIVSFLLSNIAWTVPCVNSQSDVGLADKLAAMSGAYESGIQAAARQEVAGVFLKSAILKEMGITNLTDIVRNMDELVRKGIICFSRPDIKDSSRNAIYIFEDDAFIKVTKPGEPVITDFDELLEISGKEDTVGDTKYEWCNVPKDETKLGLINSFLGRLSDGRWSLRPAGVDKEKTEMDLKGPVKTFAPHGMPVDYSSITDDFINEHEVGLLISDGKVSVQDNGTDQSKQLAELIGNAFAILDKLPDGELKKYWETVLSAEQNEVPIRIRVNNKISENSVRYYNYKDNIIEIIFDEVFIKALLTLGTSNNTACWLLAERLFHELGHDNKSGTMEDERFEEAQLILKDLALNRALRKGEIPGISKNEVDTYFERSKPVFKSGYYFKFLTQEIDNYKKQYGEEIKDLKKYFKDNDELTIINLWLWKRLYEYYFEGINKLFDSLICEEKYELVNIEGRRTGRITPRGLLLKEGGWHRDIRILMLTEDGRLLVNTRLGKRRETGRYSESVCHRVELGMSCFETALRGIAREMRKTGRGIKIDIKDIKDVEIEEIKRERLFRLDEFPSEIQGGESINRTISFRYIYILTPEQEEKFKKRGNEFLDLDGLRVDAISNIEKYTVSLHSALTTGTYDDIIGSFAKIRKTKDRVERFEKGEFYEDELEGMSAKEIADMLRLINLGNHDMEEKLLLYSGAPGSGKGTVMDLTFKGAGAPYSDLVQKLVLYHTRDYRGKEKDGVHYHFGYHDVGDEGKNRLLVLLGKGLIRTAYVNQQLQGLAENNFTEEVKLHRNDIAEPRLRGDVLITGQYQDDNDGYGEYVLVKRSIKGLSSAFTDSKMTILEGGYGWYASIKKTEQKGKKGVFTIFLTPFTDNQLEIRKKNKMYIDREYPEPEQRIKAYWILNRMRERKGIEEISIEDDSTLQRELRKGILEPLENFNLREGADNARKNAKIIEADEFITDLNDVLEKLFKSAYRFDTAEKKALARELAYEVQMKLIKDRGYKSYRLRRPEDKEKEKGDFKDDSETYVRVLEGVIQIFLKDEYKDDYTGDIVQNQFVWSGEFEEIEKKIQEVAEEFCKKYFIYLMRALIIRDILEKHDMASRVLYSYLLSCAKGEEGEVKYLKNLFNEYTVDKRLVNVSKAAGWLNDIIGEIEKEQSAIRGISDLPARKKRFWQFYNSSDFGGAKGAPWEKTLLLRLYLPSVLHDANQNIKDLVLAIIDRIDHGKKIEDFPSICRQCGIGKDSEDWNMAVKEIYPLVKDFVKENSIVASSLSLHPDKLNKKEIIYSTVKIDSLGNIVSMDVKDEARGDTRFNEELIKAKLQELVAYLKARHGEGVLGPVEEIVIVDNMGGIDSDIPPEQRGSVAYFRGKQMLIDIDVFKNDIAIKDVGGHESFEAILEIAEKNPAIREVTATYGALKALLELSPEALDSYIAFLEQPDNGLDSEEYAKLLKYIRENRKTIDDDSLISLSIGYVLNTPRYKHLEESLKGVLADDVKESGKRIELARNIYRDIVIAKRDVAETEKKGLKKELQRVIEEVKVNIKVMRTFTGERRIVGLEGLPKLTQKGIGAVAKAIWGRESLAGRLREYVARQDVNLAEQQWIVIEPERKRQLEQMVGIDVLKSQIEALEAMKNKDGSNIFRVVDDLSKVPEGAFDEKNPRVLYLFDFEDWDKVYGRIDNTRRNKILYFPTLYTSGSLYLAAHLLITGGNVSAIGDTLAVNIIMGLYSAVLGREVTEEDLEKLFKRPWEILPGIVRLTQNINALRTAIVLIEKAA